MHLEPIFPMAPVSSETIPTGEDWIAQIKLDGGRILTYADSQEVRLFNRKKNERTMHYPEMTNINNYCRSGSTILDGEVIALGENGKPSFLEVMRRDGLRKLERLKMVEETVPIIYMIFDILYLNGEWIHQKPFHERMDILPEMIIPKERIQLVPSILEGDLHYVGHTGTGKMTGSDWLNLTKELKKIQVQHHPFKKLPQRHAGTVWVQTYLTVKIKFAEWTEGGALRQPSIEGFIQIPPRGCLLERT